MSNGIRVFMISLMFSPTQNDYQNTFTKNIEQTLRSSWFREILNEYAVKSDIFLLNMHIGTIEPESHSTYKTVRALFDEFNYKIPIHVLGAHDHLVFHVICPQTEWLIKTASQPSAVRCSKIFNTQCGHSLHIMQQLQQELTSLVLPQLMFFHLRLMK
ncbi:5'_nucleotidase family protein [Hexamita inflata]|uniref:5' nucleotidase family protein n=1 Tax=Hexamita inflata TaxID=28002 RepID=A0AA86TMJ8_9EUKA|nr:5' nucleotidase family protein [Hexamita inflata]